MAMNIVKRTTASSTSGLSRKHSTYKLVPCCPVYTKLIWVVGCTDDFMTYAVERGVSLYNMSTTTRIHAIAQIHTCQPHNWVVLDPNSDFAWISLDDKILLLTFTEE